MSDSKDSLAAGTILQGTQFSYRILKTLGQGTFGITYLAELVQSSNEVPMLVCIKEFFMSDINGRDGSTVTFGSQSSLFVNYSRKFVREAKNLARISHGNVVKVIELFEANGTNYYSMSYIAGGSLGQYIDSKGHLDAEETLGIALRVADALQSLHSMGMVHLDIKPGNIMLLAGETPVLIDFGLSKNFDNDGNPESSTSIGGGTPGYAPLEQSSYSPGEGVPATMDVYALGATMYKMLTGMRPPVAAEILNSGFPESPLVAMGVSPQVIAIVRKAMEPSRANRFQTMGEFMEAIRMIDGNSDAKTEIYAHASGNSGFQGQSSGSGSLSGSVPPPPGPMAEYHKGNYVGGGNVIPPAPDNPASGGKSRKTLIVVLCCLFIPLLIVMALIFASGDESADSAGVETESLTTDTLVVAQEVPTVPETRVVKEVPASEESKAQESNPYDSDHWVLTGDMQGFPIKIELNWKGNSVSGTYYNIKYNVRLKVTDAWCGEGMMGISFGSGKEAYSMELEESRDGVWRGHCSSNTTGKTLPVTLSM